MGSMQPLWGYAGHIDRRASGSAWRHEMYIMVVSRDTRAKGKRPATAVPVLHYQAYAQLKQQHQGGRTMVRSAVKMRPEVWCAESQLQDHRAAQVRLPMHLGPGVMRHQCFCAAWSRQRGLRWPGEKAFVRCVC
jgi:hypothetical protein